MRPLDPRLMRYARATRSFIVASILSGTLTSVLVVVSAWLLSGAIVGGFEQGRGLAELGPALLGLVAVVLGRVVLAFVSDVAAARSSAKAKSQLRSGLLEHVAALGPGYLIDGESGTKLTRLATTGVDALDAYFSRYLPQLFLAVIVPVMLGVTILSQDLLAAVLVAVTVPLIPVFMALIGRYTQGRVDRQWRTLDLLAGHFLDVLAGLPTLKVFGRAQHQAQQVQRVGEEYRKATLGVVKISFLSALVLELLATISVAVVAVSIGLRLVNGTVDLRTGLFVLILAPEVYLPLRLVGMNFHAAADGVAAAEQIFEVMETPIPSQGTRKVQATTPITFDDVSVAYRSRPEPALRGATFSIRSGGITALVGPSGAGKSTALGLLLGFVAEPFAEVSGSVQIAGVPLSDVDLDDWRSRVAYVPQMPVLMPGTVASNIAVAKPNATADQVAAALSAVGLEGLGQQMVGERGKGLSIGQARRVAVARALVKGSDLLLADEPTAGLDAPSQAQIVELLQGLARTGVTVVVVAHRSPLIAVADHVVSIDGQLVP